MTRERECDEAPSVLSSVCLLSFSSISAVNEFISEHVNPRRMAVRCAAAATQKFASSIAPHITTLLVHGKQVKRRGGAEPHCFCMLHFIFLSKL